MPYCPKCGKENDENSKFCQKCGGLITGSPMTQPSQPIPQTQPYNQPPYIPPKKKNNIMIVVGVIIVVIIVIVAIAALSNLALNSDEYKATVYIHVTSNHISNVVNIDLYVDGDHVKSDTLPALTTIIYTYEAWFSGDSSTLLIEGTGQGGGFGDTYDSTTVTVQDGGTYNVYLNL